MTTDFTKQKTQLIITPASGLDAARVAGQIALLFASTQFPSLSSLEAKALNDGSGKIGITVPAPSAPVVMAALQDAAELVSHINGAPLRGTEHPSNRRQATLQPA